MIPVLVLAQVQACRKSRTHALYEVTAPPLLVGRLDAIAVPLV